jgi:hypothetical protein
LKEEKALPFVLPNLDKLNERATGKIRKLWVVLLWEIFGGLNCLSDCIGLVV